jgi:hypothetical protein
MLHNRMKHFISEKLQLMEEQPSKQNAANVALFNEEKEYAEKHHFVPDELKATITLAETSRFTEAHIERCDKESEEVIAVETTNFLSEPIEYLKKHQNEFIYLESHWWEMVGVDAVSIEIDDVFGTFNTMLGLKLQKKFEENIKTYLENHLQGDEPKYSLLFNHDDGLWNVNFALDYAEGFHEELPIGETYSLIYRLLFKLMEAAEEVS